jgi:hypothetical protein
MGLLMGGLAILEVLYGFGGFYFLGFSIFLVFYGFGFGGT